MSCETLDEERKRISEFPIVVLNIKKGVEEVNIFFPQKQILIYKKTPKHQPTNHQQNPKQQQQNKQQTQTTTK